MANFSVFVNFKTYLQATGEKAVALALACEKVSQEKKLPIIPLVQAVDLCLVKKTVKIPVWVQHLDPYLPGQATGWISLETVIKAGASGTLLNHSEHRLPPGTIKQILARIKEKTKKGEKFESIVCAKTLGQLERLVKLKPDFLAYEISELIGKKLAITDFDPRAIKHAVEICGQIPLIVGAGIHKAEDLRKAKQLGASGVLISSAVVLAGKPEEKLIELLKLI